MVVEKKVEDKIPPQLNVEFDKAPEKDEEKSVSVSNEKDHLFHFDDMFGEIWDDPFSRNMW